MSISASDVRMFFQYATVAEFCAPVERLSGRKVRSILIGIDTAVDGLSIEAFVLHRPASRASRIEVAKSDDARSKSQGSRVF